MGGDNPWKAFQQSAADGKIDIDEGAAKQAALLVAQTVTMVLIAKSAIDDTLTNYQGFGILSSGTTLRQRFINAATDLKDRLGQDETILRGMGEMFMLAGKVYSDNDDSAADNFEKFRTAPDNYFNWVNPQWDFPHVPGSGDGRRPGWASDLDLDFSKDNPYEHALPEGGRLPDSGFTAAQGGGTIPVSMITKPDDSAHEGDAWTGNPQIENAYSIEYNTYYNLGNAIMDHNQEVVDAAAGWNWVGDRIEIAFGDLANNLETLHTSGQWGGNGPQASVTAAMTYRQNMLTLTQAVNSIGTNLTWTSGWLWATGLSMPNTPWQNVGKPYARDELLPAARRAFNSAYVPGMQASSAGIPAIPPPNKELLTTEAAPPGPASPGPAGPGPGPGPGPSQYRLTSATSPGPGPGPGLTKEQQQAQQDAIREAEKQRQEALAYQREQQEAARQQQAQSAAFQQEQQDAARQQQEQQAAAQAASQAQQAAQQALSAGQQAVEQALGSGQSGVQDALAAAQQAAGLSGLSGLGLPGSTGLEAAKAAAANAVKGFGGPGPGSAPGPGLAGASSAARNLSEASKLFPRASFAAESTGLASAARAGTAATSGMPGSPGAAGAAGRGQGEGGQNHKRPAFLDSAEHLEEALGEAPRVVKPVVEK